MPATTLRCPMLRIFLLIACLLPAGCATSTARQQNQPAAIDAPVAEPPKPAIAVENVDRRNLPDVLVRAMDSAYALPQPLDCATIGAEVAALSAVLGEDIDSRSAKPGKENLALKALVSGVQGLIPYFSWIRRLSGVDRRERMALAAIAAGSIRRGYLKGLGEAKACPPPATPTRSESATATD